MPSRDFSPKKYFQKVIEKWWILFLAMLIGGLIGVGLSFLKIPRYEAEARISTSIDYTVLPDIEDYEEDRMINEAGWVMLSDAVLENVQSKAEEQGISLSYGEMLDTFTGERIDDLWTLRVVSEDPGNASDLANLWLDEAFLQLDSASEHAHIADGYREYLNTLENCLTDEADSFDASICTFEDAGTLKAEIDSQTVMMAKEFELSRGINPAARFAITSYAQVPTAPEYQARGVMTFLGLMLGFVMGLVELWFAGKKA